MNYSIGVFVLTAVVCGYLLYANTPWLDDKKYARHIYSFRVIAVGVVWQGLWLTLQGLRRRRWRRGFNPRRSARLGKFWRLVFLGGGGILWVLFF